MNEEIERVLFDEATIEARVAEVAALVTERYRGRPLLVVGVLKGCCLFLSDLVRRVPIPMEVSFVMASSYGSGTRPGELRTQYLPAPAEVAGKDVLLLDDILDTGQTLRVVRSELLERGAREVSIGVFLDKPARRRVAVEPDFRCFEVEDLFVVGYGLDFDGRYRNLPYVAALKGHLLPDEPAERA